MLSRSHSGHRDKLSSVVPHLLTCLIAYFPGEYLAGTSILKGHSAAPTPESCNSYSYLVLDSTPYICTSLLQFFIPRAQLPVCACSLRKVPRNVS